MEIINWMIVKLMKDNDDDMMMMMGVFLTAMMKMKRMAKRGDLPLPADAPRTA